MTHKFTTESGSLYELDLENKQIRRLNGPGNPTRRLGEDGVWKSYTFADVMMVKTTHILVIDWDGLGHCTLTSPIPDYIPLQNAVEAAKEKELNNEALHN